MKREPVRLLFGSLIGLLSVMLLPAAALAIDEFPLPNAGRGPAGITAGPDGALWFTEELPDAAFTNHIGRITTNGVVTHEYPIPTTNSRPAEIVTGPDGALWFTEFDKNRIGRLDPSTGNVTEYELSLGSGPDGITVGPDNAIWFTEHQFNRIGRLDPAHPDNLNPAPPNSIQGFLISPGPNTGPSDITVGPDGRLWFTEAFANKIGAITTGGTISEYPPTGTTGADPSGITSSGGALWFTESGLGADGNRIGRISTTGVIDEYVVPTASSDPSGITTGSDGALWFTESSQAGNKIGRITTGGSFTEFPLPNPTSQPEEITAGPDGALWFTEYTGNRIGRIVPAPPGGSPGGGQPPPAGGSAPAGSSGAPIARIPSSLLTQLPSEGSTAKKRCRVPKLRRLTVRRAKKKLRRAGCRFRVRGKGRVVSSRPRAGTRTSKRVLVRAKRKRR